MVSTDSEGVEGNGGVLAHYISILNKIDFFGKIPKILSEKKAPVNPIRIFRNSLLSYRKIRYNFCTAHAVKSKTESIPKS